MFLYDVNFLFAMLTVDHEHHRAARAWRGSLADKSWASCEISVSGFIRLSGNPHVTKAPKKPAEAWHLLKANMGKPLHRWLEAPVPGTRAFEEIMLRCESHRQVTDAFLIHLAIANRAVLATFDHRLKHLSPDPDAVEVIPLF